MPDTPQALPMGDATPPSPAIPPRAASALMTAAVLLSAFKNKLDRAGYPFTQPPGVRECLTEIDAILYPATKSKK